MLTLDTWNQYYLNLEGSPAASSDDTLKSECFIPWVDGKEEITNKQEAKNNFVKESIIHCIRTSL